MERCPLENGNGAELVLAYCARTLAQDECAAFERHMLSCAGCRELAAAQQAVWSALDTWIFTLDVSVSALHSAGTNLFRRARVYCACKPWGRQSATF